MFSPGPILFWEAINRSLEIIRGHVELPVGERFQKIVIRRSKHAHDVRQYLKPRCSNKIIMLPAWMRTPIDAPRCFLRVAESGAGDPSRNALGKSHRFHQGRPRVKLLILRPEEKSACLPMFFGRGL